MDDQARTHLDTASSALEAGDWRAAHDGYAAALGIEVSAEALVGLAEATWWLGDLPASVAYREQAYAAFRHRGDLAQAAEAALWVAFEHFTHTGNRAAAAGWLARVVRIIEAYHLDAMEGWVQLVRAAALVDADPVASEKHAEEACRLARDGGDLDLELCALSQLGAALVAQGRVAEGVAALDEALAGSLGGEGGNLDTVVLASCNMMSSCTRSADFERALQWIRAADRFTQRYGCPFLYTECRTFYGGVLVATGEWERAEDELRRAVELANGTVPTLHRQAVAQLAQLRVAQGRLEEAGRLVVGMEDHEAAVPVVARLQLLADRPNAAAATVRRRLDTVGEARLERAVLLELLGEAEILAGDRDAAVERGARLAASGADLGCEVMRARGERLAGQALAAGGDPDGCARLDAAIAVFVRLGMPFEAARTRLLRAEACADDDAEVAETEARTALAAFEELGAGGEADRAAALLRRLGVKAARSGPRGDGSALTKREEEVLALLAEGLSNPQIAERLYLSRKTVEHHVARVLAKMGVRTRAQAAAEAVRRTE